MSKSRKKKQAKPVSLHPLKLEDALSGLLRVKPKPDEKELKDGEDNGTQEEVSDRRSVEEASREEKA